MSAIIPIPKIEVSVRIATMDDLPFIDRLQKKNSKQLGFFPRAQIEGYIRNGWMLIAEEAGRPIAYCASRDRYQKRDELGAIFQLCVDEMAQRKLIAAMLLKEVFERSAYGTKLYCCWCAQDLTANRFWEAMGFVPLAFCAGSAKKSRVHIFWQKRIREGDVSTPWWFPSLTGGGSIREDRLVLPIPPGVRWNDPMPVLLPGAQAERAGCALPSSKPAAVRDTPKLRQPTQRRVQFGKPSAVIPANAPEAEKSKRAKKPKIKNDPKIVAAARELRDRWLEEVNSGNHLPTALGKYDVARALPTHEPAPQLKRQLQLPEADASETRRVA